MYGQHMAANPAHQVLCELLGVQHVSYGFTNSDMKSWCFAYCMPQTPSALQRPQNDVGMATPCVHWMVL